MQDITIKEYEYYMKSRPYVVILGAGASCAAIPNGDKYGRKISAMDSFIDKLGLRDILSKVDLITESNKRPTGAVDSLWGKKNNSEVIWSEQRSI